MSHGVRDEIGPSLFGHILRDQLHVDEPTFWSVVHGRSIPEAPVAPAPSPVPEVGPVLDRGPEAGSMPVT